MVRKRSHGTAGAETLSVRISSRTKYALELTARYQRRSISSVIEWWLNELMRNQMLQETDGETRSLSHAMVELWDPYEADRLVKLALKFPSLLTFEEDLIWKVIREENSFWKPLSPPAELSTEQFSKLYLERKMRNLRHPSTFEPNLKHIRESWDKIKAAANGEPVDFTDTKED